MSDKELKIVDFSPPHGTFLEHVLQIAIILSWSEKILLSPLWHITINNSDFTYRYLTRASTLVLINTGCVQPAMIE